MKTRLLIIAAIAAFVAVSCGPKVSDKTVITGDLGANAPANIELILKEANINLTVPVTDGKFKAELPACQTSLARIKAGNIISTFVSDGTPLNIIMDEEMQLKVTSKYPKFSAQEGNAILQKALLDLQKNYGPKIKAAGSTEEEDNLYDAYQKDVKSVCLEALSINKDNYVAISAIDNLQYLLSDEQLDSVLAVVGPTVAESGQINTIKHVLTAKKATAEGAKFSDFEVNDSKFSDYVGKGKYILVDFWASWCGPCKAEVPNLKNVYEKYAGKEFDILGVAVWDKEEATRQAIKDLALPWNQIIDAQSIPTDLYGIQGIPHIILFGPDGTILKRNLRGDDIEAEVAKYVKPVK